MIKHLFFDRKILYSLCLLAGLFSCHEKEKAVTLFNAVLPSRSHINFQNTLQVTDDFNIIEYLYFYNGGGVAAGDINNDGLPDLYFSANQSANRLYLNKGNLEFEDITDKAGVEGFGNWKTGVTMADVNGDGLLDIYSCGVGKYKKFTGRNQLYINNGDLTFTERSADYGLDFEGFSTQASFFDYDNDGDLDMYLVNHAVHTTRSLGHSMLRNQSDPFAGDKLYENELIPSGNMHFKEVTSKAGIFNSQLGYGLGIGVSDLNQDGFQDLYVSNDFNENDYLYLNNGNGTFRQTLESAIPHSSRFSMGNDIADINNDGWTDIFTLDMLPRDETVIKTTAGEDSYEIYDFKLGYGYHYQFSRNMLQLNQGLDLQGNLFFSDIAPLSGVEATDWSWGPVLADFDNDGFKDLFIANGIYGRPNDLDYINYISSDSAQRYFTDQQLIDQMPSGKVPNVFFKNNGDRTFQDVSSSWIGATPSLSNGATHADLDNDGDLDLIVNNVNAHADIYRNDLPPGTSNYIKVKLVGEGANRNGIGTKVWAYGEGKKILYEQILTRGWLSSVEQTMHIGVGKIKRLDSVCVFWPGNRCQAIVGVNTDTTIIFKQIDAKENKASNASLQHSLLLEGPDLNFKHRENDFIAFSSERLTPYMLSTAGPHLAIGDINRDGLDDVYVGGAKGQAGAFFMQERNGTFRKTQQRDVEADSLAEDSDAAFFDADGNGHADLIVVGGGQEFGAMDKNLIPRLYLNDGKGNFRSAELPEIFVNASCVRPADVDADGDIDLFIGGSVIPGKYGLDASSFILFNNGKGIFHNESTRLPVDSIGNVGRLGMVNDALWMDINSDKMLDLVVVGSWMPITILIQTNDGNFRNDTEAFGLGKSSGWWNTLVAHDFDKDGDLDIVAGNAGLNGRLRATPREPVGMVIGDLDNNNSLDHLITYYNQGTQHPFTSRDQLVKQVPSLKKKFLKFSTYENVTLDDILGTRTRADLVYKELYTFASSYLENLGNGRFSITPLPLESQVSPIFGLCVADIDSDGNADLITAGNLDAVQPDIGRYDAGYGVVLKGGGHGDFRAMAPQVSGFIARGEVRDIKIVRTSTGRPVYMVSRNNNTVKIFAHRAK